MRGGRRSIAEAEKGRPHLAWPRAEAATETALGQPGPKDGSEADVAASKLQKKLTAVEDRLTANEGRTRRLMSLLMIVALVALVLLTGHIWDLSRSLISP